jgi:hypothetical protein
MTPIVIAISRATDNYGQVDDFDPFVSNKDDSLFPFIGHYLS